MSSSPYPTRFVAIGTPGDRRLALFQAALDRLGLPAARVVSYADLLSGRVTLSEVVRPGTGVRIESPGKDFSAERTLLVAGAEVQDEEEEKEPFARLSQEAAARLPFDKGRILYPRQWYLGFRRAQGLIEDQLAGCPDHQVVNGPEDVVVAFDKPRCHARLARSGVAVPPALGPVRSFEQLVARMEETGCRRVFVKLAHGSSGSGVVAYRSDGRRSEATTTVEMVRRAGELRLYNSRHIRTYRAPGEIAELIDELCRHRVHVERWLPKAGIDGQAFDLRVVVIGGRARHTVVRKSRSPMTNLHLLNDREPADRVAARMGPDHWAAARRTCERAAACFPHSLYVGIDLLVSPDFRHHAVAEVNAFGDLLPGVLHEGVDTYTAEIKALV